MATALFDFYFKSEGTKHLAGDIRDLGQRSPNQHYWSLTRKFDTKQLRQ